MTIDITNEDYTQLLIDVKQGVNTSQYKAVLSVNKELVLLYYTQSISRSLGGRQVVKLKERTLKYVTETEARRLTNQELEKRRVYNIGKSILQAQAKYGWGAKVIERLSKDLRSSFTDMKGFSSRSLKYMRQFAEEYPDDEFVVDPYIFDFLSIGKEAHEREAENGLVQHVEKFILRDMNKLIGLAGYNLRAALPDELKTALPTIEELELELSKDID